MSDQEPVEIKKEEEEIDDYNEDLDDEELDLIVSSGNDTILDSKHEPGPSSTADSHVDTQESDDIKPLPLLPSKEEVGGGNEETPKPASSLANLSVSGALPNRPRAFSTSSNVERNKELPPDPPRGKLFVLSVTGIEVYLTSPSTSNSDSRPSTAPTGRNSKLVVLLTNSLGLKSDNNLRLADRYADKLKATVVVPDLFKGDPIPSETAEAAADIANPISPAAPHPSASAPDSHEHHVHENSVILKVKSLAVSFVKGFFDDMWAARHTFESTMPLLRDAIDEIYTAYTPEKIAVIGYSFGAKYVLHLLSPPPGFQSEAWASGYIDAITCGAVIHPSLLDTGSTSTNSSKPSPTTSSSPFSFFDNLLGRNKKANTPTNSRSGPVLEIGPGSGPTFDFGRVRKPLYLIYAKHDELLPEAIIKQGLRILAENDVPVETEVYDNEEERERESSSNEGGLTPAADSEDELVGHPLPHGFSVPGDYPRSVVGDRPERVFNIISTWVSEHL